jgi:hypothetical protein
MTALKRLPIKYIRDYIKKDYKLRDCCYICGSESNLELHHLYSVSELFNNWCAANKILHIDSEEPILDLRIVFATDCADSLSHNNLYTLCSLHHKRLHNLYGQRYSNNMANKVKNWLEIQKEKHGK